MRNNVVRSPKLAQRRSRVRRERVRRRRKIAAAVVVAAAAGTGAWMMTGTAVFAISTLSVDGATIVSEQAVLRASGLRIGGSALGADLDAAETRVIALPDILDASIVRDGVTVTITVEERRPSLEVRAGSRAWIVDRTGRPLLGADEVDGLPVLEVRAEVAPGERPVSPALATAVTRLWQSLSERDRARGAAFVYGEDGLSGTVGRVEVRFGGLDRIEGKVEAFHLVRKTASRDGRLVAIDVRSPARPAAVVR